jgi:UDP-N-acetylglucosamine--N-acetylmuramyl-(pentapeptide) pyrophosphoryl-undecaprenol N-acetylglucosamine transferase
MNRNEHIKVMISGGGTGGHIFPALAIARAIQAMLPEAEFLFVGAKGKMEMEKVPEAGYPIKGLWISGFQRKLTVQNLSFPIKLISSLWKARSIIKKFKPNVVVGVGGFASGPTLKMAANLGIPCLIQEQNSYPGVTNKLLATQVEKICVAYEGMEKYFPKKKIILTGNPIRKHIIDITDKREEALKYFDLEKDKKNILIVGGSLGAQSINRAVLAHLKEWSELPVQLIWQTGKTGIQEALQSVDDLGKSNIRVHTFIKKMDLAYASADIIISRAGAIAISEISAVGKPVVFIPFPHAAEDHQTKNAQRLVNKNAALMIADPEVKDQLLPLIHKIMRKDDVLQNMAKEIKKFGITDADNRIAEEVIKISK